MNYFDIVIDVRGHEVRLIGSATPYRAATGPSMDHAGGDPAEGGEVEIEDAFLIRLPHQTRRVRKYHERKLPNAIVDAIGNDPDVDEDVREELARIKRERWA